MEQLKEIEQLGGPHLKMCDCGCKKQFYGRSNQKHYPGHKSKINNAKRSQRDRKFKSFFNEIKTSYYALQKELPNRDENNWIYIGKLTKHGFDPDCATKIATNKNDVKFKYILDIAFRLSDDNKHVQFLKMK